MAVWKTKDPTGKRVALYGMKERDASGKIVLRFFPTKRKARIAEARLLLSQEDPPPPPCLFSEMTQAWLVAQKPRVKPSTFVEYEGVIKTHLLPAFSGPISDVTKEAIRNLVSSKGQSLSTSRVQLIAIVLKGILNQAFEDGKLSVNPMGNMRRLTKAVTRREINILTADEIELLLDTALEKQSDLYPICLMAARTGLREGEVFGLRFSDIDFSGRFIDVKRSVSRGVEGSPKNGKHRRVDASAQLINVLDLLLSSRIAEGLKANSDLAVVTEKIMNGYVFSSSTGKPLDASNFLKRFHLLLRQAGLRRIRFHDLRHSYASLMLQQPGANLVYIKEQLGHSSIKITIDTYGHLVPGGNREAVDRLDGLPKNRRETVTVELQEKN